MDSSVRRYPLVALSANAFAADIPARNVSILAPAPAILWTGFYVGAQVGTAQSQSRLSGSDFSVHTYAQSWNSVIGGVHAGYDYQMDRYVVGIEADVNARTGNNVTSFSAVFATSDGWDSKSAYDASIRARFGYLVTDQALVYGTAGLALQDFKFDNPGCALCSSWQGRNLYAGSRTGWTAGVGIQYAVTSAWSGTIQYRYSDYGTNVTTYNSGNSRDEARLFDNRLEFGLSYKFGAAKY